MYWCFNKKVKRVCGENIGPNGGDIYFIKQENIDIIEKTMKIMLMALVAKEEVV